ncbi:MAG TPA: hypoxanthine phosphoribosyltransferase [Bacilli bacterium]|nr:hypoxanthine phosphoribosyltransferase [Bacilli bacterium]
MDQFVEEVLFTHKEIVARSKELGQKIANDYRDKRPILIGLLKGCVPFMAELIKHINCDLELDFMKASSYEGTCSVGTVTITKDMNTSVVGRHVLIVEDIVDSGLTLQQVTNLLKERRAASIEIVALLDKPSGRTVSCLEPKYIGFTIPPKFVIGFGLDYNELYRNLDYVGVLKKSVYEK